MQEHLHAIATIYTIDYCVNFFISASKVKSQSEIDLFETKDHFNNFKKNNIT